MGEPRGAAASQPGDVLALLRAAGPLTRAEVMERTGLSRATVNQRLEALLAARLAVESDGETSARGRPPTHFAFNRHRGVLLVADVGATSMRTALTDLAGNIALDRARSIDVADGPATILGLITETFDALLREAGHDVTDVHGIGLDVPGPVDFAAGRVVSPPIMSGWDGYDIPGWFRPRFDCPVLVENDVNAMAFGEQRLVYPDVDALLMVKVGTGIGSGIIVGGRIYRGADGAAGDIGHIQVDVPDEDSPPLCRCGNLGCLEARAGGWALVRDLQAAGHSVTTLDEAIAGIHRGDTTAVGLARRAGRLLGGAIANAVSLLNPRAIVLTGQLAAAEEQLMAGIREMVYRRSPPLATARLQITRSKLDRRGGVTGTALFLADEVFRPGRVNESLLSNRRADEQRPGRL